VAQQRGEISRDNDTRTEPPRRLRTRVSMPRSGPLNGATQAFDLTATQTEPSLDIDSAHSRETRPWPKNFGESVTMGSPALLGPALVGLHQRHLQSGRDALRSAPRATPFPFNTRAQKLLAHQMRTAPPPHCRDSRIPQGLSAVVLRMLAKDPNDWALAFGLLGKA